MLGKLRKRVGRIWRDIDRQREQVTGPLRQWLDDLMARAERILTQQPKDKNKLYALHAQEVECISKGKARNPYEFGVKVSITTTHREGFVVGARSMPGRPYDGHPCTKHWSKRRLWEIAVSTLPLWTRAIAVLTCRA